MKTKTILITGASSGIGRMALLELAKTGAEIVFTSRNIETGLFVEAEIKQLTKNMRIKMMHCDLSSFESITQFTKLFKENYKRLDILVNNAGVWESKFTLSKDQIELTFAVNYLAVVLMTHQLKDLLISSAPSKIINTASGLHQGNIQFEDLEYKQKFSGFKAYRHSKLALILYSRLLAEQLKNNQVTVNMVHPGMVATNIDRNISWFMKQTFRLLGKSPEKGAEVLVFAATNNLTEKETGKFIVGKSIASTSKEAENMEIAEKLWEKTAGYLIDYL